MTSANLGSTLVAEDPERYGIIKAVFGGLCGLLTRYPERFALINNQPLNHVVVIGACLRNQTSSKSPPLYQGQAGVDVSRASLTSSSSTSSVSSYGTYHSRRCEIPLGGPTMPLMPQKSNFCYMNPAVARNFTKRDEIEVIRHTREILEAASEHALKAVDLANALRNRVGVAALGRIRQTQGGLLSLLEQHKDIVRVQRVPKHDVVYLVTKKPPMATAPIYINYSRITPPAEEIKYITQGNFPQFYYEKTELTNNKRHISLFINPDIPVDATIPKLAQTFNQCFPSGGRPFVENSDVESEPPTTRRHTIEYVVDGHMRSDNILFPAETTTTVPQRRSSFDQYVIHNTSPPPALAKIWDSEPRPEYDERRNSICESYTAPSSFSCTTTIKSENIYDEKAQPSVIGPKPKESIKNNPVISSQYSLYPTNAPLDNQLSSFAPPLLDLDSQQRLFESATQSRRALERLCSESFVPTQLWPRDDND
eukprot:CAMPEP_0197349010 /NCGR_PEP_ID=MMETSP0893-20130614/9105_1 /TAXON_ID=44058 ORGANISM="Aureoumbra lagunensis, Strain CCMP1510" /NCGR_SAMPLE_ID=MMETSP0893 /ASSEMBLY_ACC=CAM_ASM_000539 /LENGTH=480 /DNA_ID=CAMNT_0042859965 /DNA_START=270 /DNA_END=1712 /DNA_ORIENTATION=-